MHGEILTEIWVRRLTIYTGAKTKICNRKYSFLSRGFISVMAESEATSPSDANLDFDADTLKGNYILWNISIENMPLTSQLFR